MREPAAARGREPGTGGVAGKGGPSDSPVIVAAHRTLFVQSGYGHMGAPGDLLLAFKPRGGERDSC